MKVIGSDVGVAHLEAARSEEAALGGGLVIFLRGSIALRPFPQGFGRWAAPARRLPRVGALRSRQPVEQRSRLVDRQRAPDHPLRYLLRGLRVEPCAAVELRGGWLRTAATTLPVASSNSARMEPTRSSMTSLSTRSKSIRAISNNRFASLLSRMIAISGALENSAIVIGRQVYNLFQSEAARLNRLDGLFRRHTQVGSRAARLS